LIKQGQTPYPPLEGHATGSTTTQEVRKSTQEKRKSSPTLEDSVRQFPHNMSTDGSHTTKARSDVQHDIISIQQQIGHSTPVIRQASVRRHPPKSIQQTNGVWMSAPLEELVRQRKPQDLTKQVVIQSGPPVGTGGFATIHVGELRGVQVGSMLYYLIIDNNPLCRLLLKH
jgi:hypothetical protein